MIARISKRRGNMFSTALARSTLVGMARRFLMSPAGRSRALRYPLQEMEIQLLRRHGGWIFDAQYYRTQNPDVAASGVDPIRHYVRHGAGEGRNPSPYFETTHYLNRHAPGADWPITPLTHFLLIGRNKRLSPCPWFDYAWYAMKNPDVAIATPDLYRHFVEHGVYEDRSPTSAFDAATHAAAYPSALRSGLPLFQDFLRRAADRSWLLSRTGSAGTGTVADLPDDLEAAIKALPRPSGVRPVLDVVIPVYRGLQETLSCLWHVLKSPNRTPFEVVVIDDRSPEPELSQALGRLAADGRIRLLTNDRNLGFVASVNRGMRLNGDRDVILLNSDTEVFNDWIDRLANTASSDPRCATVTPLTNNGTICSYPKFVENNSAPLELAPEEVDSLSATANAGRTVPLPTAVGFCMYIKRAALGVVGLFDEEAFGLGYGEENDFSLRAQAAGWKDFLAADVFVRHLGATSFQASQRERMIAAQALIDARYPAYASNVRRFIDADPVRQLRANIDTARLARFSREKNILMISHSRGGGTEQHVQEEIARLANEATAVFRMRSSFDRDGAVQHFHPDVPDLPNMPALDLEGDKAAIIELWDRLGISDVHVHHLVDFGAGGAQSLSSLLERAGRPWLVTIHDYLAICPRVNLVDEHGMYCGEPDEAGCRLCLCQRGSEFGTSDIVAWRKGYHRLLKGAVSVVVPDEDVSERLARYFPDLVFEVRPHDDARPAPSRRRMRKAGEPVRVGLLGGISRIKGFNTLVACAESARRRKLPLHFVVVGFTENDARARRAGVTITGPYVNDGVLDRIEEMQLDTVFFASTSPESYSYTLSIAMRSGLPIVAFDIGAVGRRLRTSGAEAMLLDIGADPDAINRAILSRAEATEEFS